MIVVLLIIVLIAGALSLATGIGGGWCLLIVLGVLAFGLLIIGLTSSMQEKAVEEKNEKKLKVLDWIGKFGMTVGGITSVVGLIMAVVGFVSSNNGSYGYELHSYDSLDGSHHDFLQTVIPNFMWVGIVLLGLGIVLFIVAATLRREQKGEKK